MTKYFALDMDKTFYIEDSKKFRKNIDTFIELNRRCIVPFFCTGRSYHSAMNLVGNEFVNKTGYMGYPGVYSNGAVVYGPDGSLISHSYFLKDFIQKFVKYITDNNLCGQTIFGDTEMSYSIAELDNDFKDYPKQKNITAFEIISPNEVINKKITSIHINKHVQIDELSDKFTTKVCANETTFHISPKGITKAFGVKMLLHSIGLTPKECLFIGNGENDIELLEFCGSSYAVGNANDDVKKAAKTVLKEDYDKGAFQKAARLISRFLGNHDNISKLFEQLKEAKTRKELLNFKFNINTSQRLNQVNGFCHVGPLKLKETSNNLKCVDNEPKYTSNITSLLDNTHNHTAYKANKNVIIDCFEDLALLRSKKQDLALFLLESLNVVLNDLEFEEVCRLLKHICNLKLNDTSVDCKIQTLYKNLLTRVNYLVTQMLSDMRGVVKIDGLPKYSKDYESNGTNKDLVTDLKGSKHLDETWKLWYNLTKKGDAKARNTCTLLLSLLELETGWIFKSDIRRVCRTLDAIVGECESFSKLEERCILKLVKRLGWLLLNETINGNEKQYIKNNNITPIHLKKLFCNIAKISKISPKVLVNSFKLSNTSQSFGNLIAISRRVFESEGAKLKTVEEDYENESRFVSEEVTKRINELNFKSNKLFLKIFAYSVDIIKFIDYLLMDQLNEEEEFEERYKGISGLKSELIRFSEEILSKVQVKSEDLIISECRSMYYLALTTSLNRCGIDNKTQDLSKNTETMIKSVNNNMNMPSEWDPGDTRKSVCASDVNKMTTKYVQYLLYADKVISFIDELRLDLEKINDTYEMCKLYAEKLSNNYKVIMDKSEDNHVLQTIYVTMLNKYNLLSKEVYLEFLSKISQIKSWNSWSGKEISMLCDLFSRTREKLGPPDNKDNKSYQAPYMIRTCLKSLLDYYILHGNVYKLGNREFISLISCMNAIEDFIFSSSSNIGSLIRDEILNRIDSMNFNQLIKLLLNLSNHVDEQLRGEVLKKMENLDCICDISNLVELNDKEVTSRVLARYKIEIVDKRYVLFEKYVKNKFLKRYGKVNYNKNYTTEEKFTILANQLM
ncbi:haloacid dehalogenase-like family hydrolase [Theileria orientalis strain Shintoku]|uniref:Haloacid dehalogenase-like family hydrolase n=1 Tax=Theileria orientalis strain Shintoku TaxID=869250 RepID=J4D6H2_THEOR|nr:haloacid dehalogenase-like family hydrolase [Theileria orientalis strain Shintoku]BAM39570.1 haloacid dehalogenase-like family hydrolase [Theileria orientalis strain Shintoku]|eukprot:XP_009689871.1 haloacid dehalogenase-like family hydrolase [Theileria orientalis strain Shintoku]